MSEKIGEQMGEQVSEKMGEQMGEQLNGKSFLVAEMDFLLRPFYPSLHFILLCANALCLFPQRSAEEGGICFIISEQPIVSQPSNREGQNRHKKYLNEGTALWI